MAKTHLIKDESIGGVLREFIEVDRPAKFGDQIICTFGKFRTLEPTDTVVIAGERFRMVERKAKEGDKVIVIEEGSGFNVGDILMVEYVTDSGTADIEGGGVLFVEEYIVLEPVASDDLVTAEEGDDKSVIELLANLARRVTSLEQQLRDMQRNVETFAEQTEANTKDIAYLDERTRSTNDDSTFTLTQIIEALGGACR